MTCYKCGLELSAFETACPRCSKKDTPTGTSRLPDFSSSRTQHLVQLEQCKYCRMLLFPADTFCPSCGVAVDRSYTRKTPASRKNMRVLPSEQRWVAVGVAVSVLLLAVFIYALKHP